MGKDGRAGVLPDLARLIAVLPLFTVEVVPQSSVCMLHMSIFVHVFRLTIPVRPRLRVIIFFCVFLRIAIALSLFLFLFLILIVRVHVIR